MDSRELKKLRDLIRNSAGTRMVMAMLDDALKMQSLQVSGLDGEEVDEVERFQNYGFTGVPHAAEALAIPVGGDRGHMVIVALDDRATRKIGLAPGEVSVYQANGDYILLKDGNEIEIVTKIKTTKAEDKSVTETKEHQIEASDSSSTQTTDFSVDAFQRAAVVTQDFQVAAGTRAAITSPQISLSGALTVTDEKGGRTVSWFWGDVHIEGDVYIHGNLKVTGDVSVTGDVTADGDVVAGGVSLRKHTHEGDSGGVTGPPLGG